MPDLPELPEPHPALPAVEPAPAQPQAMPQDDPGMAEHAEPVAAAALPGSEATAVPAAPVTTPVAELDEPVTDTATAAHREGPAATDGPAVAETLAAPAAAPLMSPAACGELLRQHFPALFTGPAKPLKLRIQQDIQQRAPGVFTKGALSAFFRRYTGSTGYLIALGKATQRFDLDGQPAGELSEEHRQLARDELTRRRQLTREREQQARAAQRPPASAQAPGADGDATAAVAAEGLAPTARPPRPDRPARTDRPDRAKPHQRPDRPERPVTARRDDGRPPANAAHAARPPRPHRDGPGAGAPAWQPNAPMPADGPAPSLEREVRAAPPAPPAQPAEPPEVVQARLARAVLLRDFQRTTLTLANFCALKGMKPDQLNPLLEQARQEAAAYPTAPRPVDDRRGPPGPRRDDRPHGPRDARAGDRRDERRPGAPDARRAPRGPGSPSGRS